jgi:hypothetical protein
MKNVLRSVLHSVVFASVAIAASSAAAKSKQTADEFMSPDELLRELGVDPSKSVIEHTSSEMPRIEVIVDKAAGGSTDTSQRALVYLDGELLYRWKVSTGREQQETTTKTGRSYFSATPVGTYRIHTRTLNHHSTLWDADMPFAQFFKGGVAIHATMPSHYAELGQRASGGCVRLRNTSAEKLYRLVNCLGTSETAITVVNRSRHSGLPPVLAGRQTWVNQSPQFYLNCQNFEDSLVLPSGRVVQCNPTRKDMPWEARECTIKKSVYLKTGQPGIPTVPPPVIEPDEGNSLNKATPVVELPKADTPAVSLAAPVTPLRKDIPSGSYKFRMDDTVVIAYLRAAQLSRSKNNETEARDFERQALNASLAADQRDQDARVELVKASSEKTQAVVKSSNKPSNNSSNKSSTESNLAERTYLNYLKGRTSQLQ